VWAINNRMTVKRRERETLHQRGALDTAKEVRKFCISKKATENNRTELVKQTSRINSLREQLKKARFSVKEQQHGRSSFSDDAEELMRLML